MHNPNKNRALCVVAKSSYWSLRVFGWLVFVAVSAALVTTLAVKAYQHWNWREIGKGVVAMLIIAVGFFLPIILLFALYEWAKSYRRDC